jgi:hypothetical protein
VVGDDEHTLAAFPSQTNAAGTRHLLLRPEAQDHAPMPKALKPDLEALCVLPDGSLLAIPSGSAPTRRLGAVISLINGRPMLPARLLDFGPLFDRLAKEVPSLNIEGGAVIGQRLWLAQRGNKRDPSALIELDVNALGGSEVPGSALHRVMPLSLGELDGIPFTPTDLCPLSGGRLIVSAVCEDTADSYNDGAFIAAGIAILQPGRPVERFERLEPHFKVEGVIARPGSILWMVCDADDPARPSPLLEGKL